MTLAMDMKKQIQKIKNNTIKNILNHHFNQEAVSLSFIFNLVHKKDDRTRSNEWLDKPARGKNGLPETQILATAFAHAPTAVCNELLHALTTIDKQEAVDIISKPWTGILSLSGGFYNIYITAPQQTRLALSAWVSQLEPQQIMQIFSGSRGLLGYPDNLFYKRSIDVFSFNEPAAVKDLIQALKKLSHKDLLTLFQTSSFPLSRYCGLVDLFSKISSDETAILLLELVSTLPVKDLNLLFYGRMVYTGSREDVDNLMRHVSRFSPQVLTKSLQLLRRLPVSDVKTMLLSGEEDWINPLTPLETTFSSRNQFQPLVQAELAIAFIDVLNSNKALRQLLIKAPRQDSEPFLHQLARHQVLPAIAHYLEQSKLPSKHTNNRGETALYIAESMKDQGVTSLLKARSLHYFLLKKKKKPGFKQALIANFQKTLTHFPGILATRWTGEKSLAHIAVIAKSAEALQFLLAHGADANAKDAKQLSPLDYAINSEELESIKVLAAHSKTDFTQVRKDGTLPLPYLLNKSDYTISKGVITNLRAHADQRAEQSFAAAMVQLAKTHHHPNVLQQQLEKPEKTGSLCLLLSDYTEQTNDTRRLFLLHAGELVSVSKHPALLQAAFDFVTNQLNTLADASPPLAKEHARMDLLLFLFAMKPEALTLFLKTLTLPPLQRTQLDLVLCHGLVQPLIFSRFTLLEHQLIHDCFSDKSASLNNIARIHFRRSNLTLLPPELLKILAKGLPENELYRHSENRLNPSLIVLALEHELARESPDEEKITRLFASLTKELNLFNQESSPLSNDELRLMLNVTKAPGIKDLIQGFILKQKEKAAIISKIDTLFTAFRRDEPLMDESLLREIYIGRANDPIQIRQTINQSAFMDLLAIATPEEVRGVLNNLQQTLLPRFKIDSLLATAISTNKKTPSNHQLPAWLYSLDNQTARMALFPFVSMASELSNEAQALANLLNDDSQDLKDTLPSLAKALSKLADALIKSQFENTTPAWTKALDNAFQTMLKTCALAALALEQNITRTSILEPRLLRLIQEQAGSTFPEALKNAYLALDEKQDLSLQQALATSVQLKPLQSLFSVQPTSFDEPLLAKATHWQADDLRQFITRLNTSISQGILANSKQEELLPTLIAWQISNGYLAPSALLLQQLAPIINSLNPATLLSISEQQSNILVLAEKSAPLLRKLRHCRNQKSGINEVLDCFTTTDTEILTSFVAFTAQAQLHDLNQLAHYALSGKTMSGDNTLLKSSDSNYPTSWLRKSLTSLTEFASSALSIKALITGVYQDEEQCEARLNALSDLIRTHKMPLTLEAITLFATSYSTVLSNDLFSPASSAFVLTFSELMQQSNFSLQTNVLSHLSSELINQLLEHCLSGSTSDDPARAASCKRLLTRLCQQAGHGSEVRLLLIKKRLGQQDFDLLGDESLILIAKDVLNEKTGLDDLTYDGVWIQRLLVSPRFVAACSPEIVQRLTERYRALSLTLKQNEFDQLNRFITGKLSFAEQHNTALLRWQKELLANPKAKARLLAKQERLLTFRADDSIRALFNQLEDNCLELRKTEPELADKALNTLYTHHNQQLASLRSDVLFRMADFVYTRAMRAQGDIPKSKNPLLSWLEQHLPHYNFQQSELERKTHVYLYNEAGQKIGYLDESNHAFALVNDEPIPLIDVDGWDADSVLYDENRQRLGILTPSGQFKHENLFQHHSSALLVGKMPIDQLALSPAALDLLIQDIFIENSLNTLFEASDSEEKNIWIQQQLAKQVKKEKKPISAELMSSFVAHHPIESILETLGHSAKSANAERLFAAILANDLKRAEFFANRKSPLIAEFLKRINVEQALNDYLHQHYNKSWFNEGLRLFADYAKQTSKRSLLSNALQALNTCVVNKTVPETIYDGIIATLLSSNAIAKTVLEGFLADSKELSVQKSRSTHSDNVTRFFAKPHLIAAIKMLNEQKSWEKSDQYRLLLTICNAEHEQLFPSMEPRSAEKLNWNAEELKQMSRFAIRHVQTPTTHDKNSAIGQRLLGELVFRCANLGQTDLFYQKNGKLNTRVAASYLKRSTLNALASRFYLVNYAKETIEKFRNTVKKWFASSDDDKIMDELKGNHAIIDWKALAKESWGHTKGKKLPLIAAFLINYSGASAALLRLLHDILTNRRLLKKNDLVHHISQIMAHYPHRDVSHVIFKALEDAAIANPKLLDKTVLKNMQTFHAFAHLTDNQSLKPQQAELALLSHFGQQKHYALTQHCAKLLYKPITWGRFFSKCLGSKSQDNELTNKKFGRVLTEARIEGALQDKIGRRFFKVQKALKRWWHYGIRGMKTPSGIVKFCDDNSLYTHPGNMPSYVKTPEMGGQAMGTKPGSPNNQKRIKERYQAFMDKEAQQQKTPKMLPSLPKAPGKLGIFADVKKVLDTPLPEEFPMLGMTG